ncbi:MAG: hypothetical protein F6K55_19175 [Moorea sp. SIO4A3]|nr:hypothetical protein [Moorena sp. SIO4A3]
MQVNRVNKLQVNRVNKLQVGRLQINQVTSCRLCSQLSFTIFVVEYNLKPTLANRPRDRVQPNNLPYFGRQRRTTKSP